MKWKPESGRLKTSWAHIPIIISYSPIYQIIPSPIISQVLTLLVFQPDRYAHRALLGKANKISIFLKIDPVFLIWLSIVYLVNNNPPKFFLHFHSYLLQYARSHYFYSFTYDPTTFYGNSSNPIANTFEYIWRMERRKKEHSVMNWYTKIVSCKRTRENSLYQWTRNLVCKTWSKPRKWISLKKTLSPTSAYFEKSWKYVLRSSNDNKVKR